MLCAGLDAADVPQRVTLLLRRDYRRQESRRYQVKFLTENVPVQRKRSRRNKARSRVTCRWRESLGRYF